MTGAGAEERLDDLPNGKIRMAKIYGAGAVIGFTPQQINQMSMWQFQAAVDGYVDAHSVDKKGGNLSDQEADEIWDWMQDHM